MLFLNPPFYVINGVSLLPDHQDPLQYYYMPMAPKLTTTLDAAGATVPQLQLVLYTGTAGSGGFLNLDVNIGVPQEILDDVAGQLQNLARLRDRPRLAPISCVDGTVRLMLLDKQSDLPAAGGAAGGTIGHPAGPAAPAPTPAPGTPALPQFVVRISGAGKPALYGDNQAAFSVALTQWGAELLSQTLAGDVTPVGVVYSLDFYALRPAYNVRLFVHWDRVQTHLDEEYTADTVFFSSDIDKTVDRLIDGRDIELDIDTEVAADDDPTVISDRERAVNEVREMITNAFFTPSLDPVKEAKDGWDRAADTADRVSRLAVTGGLSSLAHFGYKKIDYTRIDQKNLNVNMRERTTVRRSIYPQGHLSGLARTLTQSGVDLNRFIVRANIDDPFFQRRRVSVYFPHSLAADAIDAVEVNLDYAGDVRTAVLSALNNGVADADWATAFTDGPTRSLVRDVTARYKINFLGADPTQRPSAVESPPEVFTGEVYSPDTSDLYQLTPVPIHADPGFPWERYPRVRVETRYVDPANSINLSSEFFLDKDHGEVIWQRFSRDRALTTFEYRVTHFDLEGRSVVRPWLPTSDGRVSFGDPFGQKRKLTVVPSFLWQVVDRAFVDVFYEDPDNGLVQRQAYEFSTSKNMSQLFTVDLRDPQRQRVGYEATILFKDTRAVSVPRSYTLKDLLVATADMKAHRIISVRSDGGDFESAGLRQIEVRVRHGDPSGGAAAAGDAFKFTSAADRGYFEFDYANEHDGQYEFQVTYQFANGLSREVDWAAAGGDDLVIPTTG